MSVKINRDERRALALLGDPGTILRRLIQRATKGAKNPQSKESTWLREVVNEQNGEAQASDQYGNEAGVVVSDEGAKGMANLREMLGEDE